MTDALANNPIWRDRLKVALETSGRSKREVSLSAGLGPNYLHEVLTSGKDPTIGNLMAIAGALNLSVSFLVGEEAA